MNTNQRSHRNAKRIHLFATAENMPTNIHIGTSGYQYDHWKGVFYPEDAPKNKWFGHYVKHFDTVEINNTFYNMPKAETFDDWKDAAPKGFCYVLKYSRYGTHMKKLKAPGDHLSYFLERAEHLGNMLGPILVQLPPNWNCNPGRLDEFLDAAPKKHRWAVELRDPDWLCDEIYGVLRAHNTPLVIHDMIPDHPRVVTADWIYLRFHGEDYGGSYSDSELEDVASRIKDHLSDDREVFAYFNNDAEGCAVQNALTLKEMLAQ